ncbi:MAG: MATE family efflux transporter [Parachlamydiales bacterium]
MALTKYLPGSVRELWSVAFPLMLSSFCLLAMVFTDRVFLAHYSGEAMCAALTAGTAAWAVAGSLLIFASMAEVYVAQYNGAGKFDQLGRPVWQMVYFALASSLLFLAIGTWGGPLLFKGSANEALEVEYFYWFMAFGFSWPLLSALSTFFIGQGKTQVLMWLSLLANALNILLDWLLIFGIEGWLEPMGVKGAAIATNIGNLFQVVILLVLFLKRANRERYGTSNFRFDLFLFRKCLKVAVPQTALYFIEMVGFTLFYLMLGRAGPEALFIGGAAQSVIILFFFACEGMGRGAIAVAGNFIGAGQGKEVFKVFRAGLKIHIAFGLILSLFLVFFPDLLLNLFLHDSFAFTGMEMSEEVIAGMRSTLLIVYALSLAYLFLEGIRWLISGILTAAGDALFLLSAGAAGVAFALLLPTYWLIVHLNYGAVCAFAITSGFAAFVGLANGLRLWSGRWQKINLVDTALSLEGAALPEAAD